MTPSEALGLGFLLVVTGAVFYLVIRFLLRRVPANRSAAQPVSTVPIPASLSDHNEAVLLIEPGGRIRSMNYKARQLFGLHEQEQPNLERLAHRTRPEDRFLNLCAVEGRASFGLNGRLVEATSYVIQPLPQPVILMTLREPDLTQVTSNGQSSFAGDVLRTITDLSRAMAASLDIEDTLRGVLENVEKLLPADHMEITVWDTDNQWLVPYRFSGILGEDRKLVQASERYLMTTGLSGALIRDRRPMLIPDVFALPDLKVAFNPAGGLGSYIGVPLLVEDDLIGTIELASSQANTFSEKELDLLKLMSGQAAVALHNAQLYHAEQHRSAELVGLVQLSQAFGSMRDPKDLYSKLVESIAPLIQVDVLGFLIYNENSRTIEGQVPFKGLPDQLVGVYRSEIQPNSEGEKILIDQDVLITENASAESRLEALGIRFLAEAASLRDMTLMPLISTGHFLGYLQAGNHTDGSIVFTSDELHLLTIIANQAAPIIENANLVQQTRQRALRAEALRRITGLASSAATLDEILKFAVNELVRLLKADVGLIFLLNESRGELVPHLASSIGVPPDSALSPESLKQRIRLTEEDPQYPFSITASMHAVVLPQISYEKTLVPVYKTLAEELGIQSAVAAPLVVRDRGIGEIWLGGVAAGAFDRNDLQVVATAGGQLAGVVERSFQTVQTDESLRRRVDQLTALTRISRELSTTLDFKYLLQVVYDEALRTTRAECGTILLMAPNGTSEQAAAAQVATITAPSNGNGSSPSKTAPFTVQYYVGDAPIENNAEIGLSELETAALLKGEAILVSDFAQGHHQPPHAGVKSALLVPIVYQQKVAGLIHLHASTAGRFDADALEITQALSVQVAIVLGNVLQYRDQMRHSELLNRQVDTLAKLFETSEALHPGQPLEQALNTIAKGIQQATKFKMVLVSTYDAAAGGLHRISQAGVTLEAWDELRSRIQPWHAVQPLLQPEFRFSRSYYVPADRSPRLPEDIHTVAVLPSMIGDEKEDSWNSQDFFLVPLYDQADSVLGLISLDAPSDGRRPDRSTIEAVEIFAAQAELVIENHRKHGDMENEITSLRQEQRRLEGTSSASQARLPALLHKDLEQALTIQRLNWQMARVRGGLEIAVIANRQSDAYSVLSAVAREMLTRMHMDISLVAENSLAGPTLLQVAGSVPVGANPESLFGQRNPLRQALQDGELVLVENVEARQEWSGQPLLQSLGARSFVCLPVVVENRVRAAILGIALEPLPAFTDEDRQIYLQLTRQVAITLQNLNLLSETRSRLQEVDLLLGFSRQLSLGSLDQSSILKALIESTMRAIPAAHAGTVMLWDLKANQLATQTAAGYSDNSSMEQIAYRQASGSNSATQRIPLPLQAFAKKKIFRVDEVNFARDYNLSADDLLRYRRATGGRLPVSSLFIPIQSGATSLGLLALDNFATPGAFTQEDEALTASLAQQTALALENARLFQASEQRTAQLQALTEVAETMTASLHSDELITSLLDQFQTILPYDTATLWLREGSKLTVAAASGFADSEQRMGISADVADSQLFAEMIKTRQPIFVPDVRIDPRFPSLIEMERRSWLGIPLLSTGEVSGLIAVEKTEAGFYAPEHIQAASAFTSQASVALENARLYEESLRRAAELDQRTQRLALLNRLSGELAGSLDAEHILRLTAQELLQAMDCSVVSAITFNEKTVCLQAEVTSTGTALPSDEIRIPSDTPLFDRLRETMGIFSTGDVTAEADLEPLRTFFERRGTQSLLAVPLVAGSSVLGILMMQADRPYRFSLPEIELALTVSNQTAIAFQNAGLFDETRRLTTDLEERVRQRTVELSHEHRNTETLLQVITELSASLDMNQVLNRTLAVLNTAVEANQSAIFLARGGPIQAFFRTGRENRGITHTGSLRLPVELISGKPSRAATNIEPTSPLEQQIGALALKRRQAVMVEDLRSDTRFEISQDVLPPYDSILAAPLVFGEEVLGVLMMFAVGIDHFGAQVSLIEAASRQIAVALNNAELFNLIRDQAENLGNMLRDLQVEASRSRAILEAVADGVLVTDNANRITLFNASAESILDLKGNLVLGQSLDQFSGLFGKSARSWMHTIRLWSSDPMHSQTGETYADQITLENGHIVAVHLAPVFLRSQFLGTVSIFRDITHEVQVDRLKSEFVANVSHELRTPMTSIKGYVEILLMGAAGQLNPQQVHFLDVVRSNTQRLSVLVNDLLDVSRIEAGRVTLSISQLDMAEIARDVANDLQRRSLEENKPMSLTLDLAPDLPRVDGDAERVRQIVSNLVSNSYNYTPANGKVILHLRALDDRIQVDVEDNGVGIARQDQARIFERFYRGEDPLVLATAGTGLGLSIVKTLVDMHHGKIWFESSGTPGEGSVFSFTLPVRQPAE